MNKRIKERLPLQNDIPLTLIEVKYILQQQLLVLIWLKELKIIHRDVKPGNILFKQNTTEIHSILIDFGLSAKLEEAF
jgi:serine/threonine protein kinase